MAQAIREEDVEEGICSIPKPRQQEGDAEDQMMEGGSQGSLSSLSDGEQVSPQRTKRNQSRHSRNHTTQYNRECGRNKKNKRATVVNVPDRVKSSPRCPSQTKRDSRPLPKNGDGECCPLVCCSCCYAITILWNIVTKFCGTYLQLILLLRRANGSLEWSWTLIFLPTWIGHGIELLVALFFMHYVSLSKSLISLLLCALVALKLDKEIVIQWTTIVSLFVLALVIAVAISIRQMHRVDTYRLRQGTGKILNYNAFEESLLDCSIFECARRPDLTQEEIKLIQSMKQAMMFDVFKYGMLIPQSILIALRADGIVHWSWHWVAVPAYLTIVVAFIFSIAHDFWRRICTANAPTDKEKEPPVNLLLIMTVTCFEFLLALKIGGVSFSYLWFFLPIMVFFNLEVISFALVLCCYRYFRASPDNDTEDDSTVVASLEDLGYVLRQQDDP